MNAVAVGAIAFGVAAVVAPPAGRLAVRLGVVDRPGPLKVQARAVPYLGGLAVFAGLLVAAAAGRPAWAVPLLLALILGLAEDARGLPIPVRVAGQAAVGISAALAVAPGGGWVGRVAVVVATVMLMNAGNLIDRLDALAAGVLAAGALGFAGVLTGDARLLAAA